MKILYVIRSFYPAQLGGPNNTVYWAAKELVKLGYDVTVVSLNQGLSKQDIEMYDITFNTENDIDGIRTYYFEYTKTTYLSIKLYRWLNKNIQEYDLVLLNSYFHPISWYVAILCNFNRIRFSLAPRGELEDNALVYSAKKKQLMHHILLKRIYKYAAFFLVTSQQELRFSKKYYPDMQYELIPNYIETDGYTLSEEEVLKKNIILYLGRIHPKKGIEYLIDAYSMINSELAGKYPLVIAGFGEEEYVKFLINKAEKSIYSKSIKFVGKKTGIEKEKLYKSAKIFVLPSNSENFGNVVLEALSYSTPVITSIYTPWEEIQDNCGFWIDNKPENISKSIDKILKMNDREYLHITNNANKFVNEKYDMKKNIYTISEIYNKYSKKENKNETTNTKF